MLVSFVGFLLLCNGFGNFPNDVDSIFSIFGGHDRDLSGSRPEWKFGLRVFLSTKCGRGLSVGFFPFRFIYKQYLNRLVAVVFAL